MSFDNAAPGGDCCISQQSAPLTTFNNCDSNTVCISNQCDTASNTAVNKLPSVELAGTPDQILRANQARMVDAPPPRMNAFPQISNFPIARAQSGLALNDSPAVPLAGPPPVPQPGQFPPTLVPPGQAPRPGLLPQPGENFAPPFPVNPPGANPFPPRPDASVKPGDKPIPNGPMQPAPMVGSFTADQARQILQDRDRALALNRGQKPSDIPGPGVGPLPPSPDGRIPNFPRPDAPPKPSDGKPRPSQVEFDGNIDAAKKAAIDSGRPLIISFTKPGCGACTELDSEAWPNQSGTVSENAVRVKINGSRNRSLAQQFNITGYPTTVVVNPGNMQVLERAKGAISSDDLGSMLQRAFQKHRGGG